MLVDIDDLKVVLTMQPLFAYPPKIGDRPDERAVVPVIKRRST
jgi:hypothetical protein